MNVGRILELQSFVPRGPWRAGRSDFDGALVVYDQDGNPLALIYAGHDFAEYVAACSPAILLADEAAP